MKQEYKNRVCYDKMTDKQIVEKILSIPHDEEAAAYLLFTRYHLFLLKVYNDITSDDSCFDDCVQDLFIHFRCNDNTWQNLASFEWRSTFGYWLGEVARNKFQRTVPKLIESKGCKTSIDNNNPDKPSLQIAGENGEDTIERRERRVMLLEAIGQLEDEDQRFVILKRLQGYNSKEIAILLQKKWQKYGIRKYNKDHKLIVPSVGYVDVHVQRAKKELRKILNPYK